MGGGERERLDELGGLKELGVEEEGLGGYEKRRNEFMALTFRLSV